MSSSSTETGSASIERAVLFSDSGRNPTHGIRTIGGGRNQTSNTDRINSVHFLGRPQEVSIESKITSSSPDSSLIALTSRPSPKPNGDITKLQPHGITLSPLIGFVGPATTDPNSILPSNMTPKDRERRAALLADSPELPSKPIHSTR